MLADPANLEPVYLTVDMGSRLKISGRLLKNLGWDSHKEDFQCFAVYAAPGECWCAPAWLGLPEGAELPEEVTELMNHPFADILRVLQQRKSGHLPKGVAEMPSVDTVLLQHRVTQFTVSPTERQVNFPIGQEMLRLILGDLNIDNKSRVCGVSFAGILMLLAPNRVEGHLSKNIRDTFGRR